MKKIKEYMNEMTKEGWMAFSAIALLVLIFIIGLIIFYVKNPTSWPLTVFTANNEEIIEITDVEVEDEEILTEENVDEDDFINIATQYATKDKDQMTNEYSYNVSTVDSFASYQQVKIGLIIKQNEYQIDNIIEGSCGDVYLITAFMPGPAVLTNSLKALFGNTVYADFLPGNIIPSYHPNLTLQNVLIDNGIAKIYLGGTFSGSVNGSCDATLALAQITQTALSYPNVTAVQIFQNGDLIN